jgi:VCBS repeat-containing protein
MATMTFRVNDASTDSTNPSVWVTITETSNGALSFTITQENGVIGDLRGVFFDVADESLLSTLKVNANSSDIRIGDDLIRDLGDGSNMNGLTGSDKGYDVGIEIGTAGIGKDDIQGYTFTLSSTARNLTLADFSQVDFGVRLTSVGMISGKRVDSSKLLENTSIALQLANVDAQLSEDTTTSGNVLSGLQLLGSTQITGWNGNAVGSQLVLTSENDTVGVVTLNYDGSYTIDTSMADELSANESIIFDLAYSAKNQDEATSWSTDSASFSIAITGTNDSPVADDDDTGAVSENSVQTGNVLANDSDIDRLDTIQVASLEGGTLGEAILINNGAGANFKLNANGSYILDSSTADALSEGETITQSFTYTLTDNHNATDTATIAVKITGQNDAPEAGDDDAGATTENGVRSGNVLVNDSDIDRLDTLSISAINNATIEPGGSISVELASGAIVTMFANGDYHYDTNGAFTGLLASETSGDSFTYTVSDGHGGFDTAVVNLQIRGEGSDDLPVVDTPIDNDSLPTDMFPAMAQDISNVVLYLDDGNSATGIMKIKLQPEGLSIRDVDDLKIFDFIQDYAGLLNGNSQLVGISIHAGQEYPNLAGTDMTAQGEGPFFFLLDGESSAAEAIGTRGDHGWTMNWENDDIPLTADAIAMGLNYSLLANQAQTVFTHFNGDMWSL